LEISSQPKFCSVCRLASDPQVLVCEHCGSVFLDFPLEDHETIKNIPIRRAMDQLEVSGSLNIPSRGMAFFLFGKTKPIAVLNEEVIYLGRVEKETTEAFVDLSIVNGFDMGVSRRHAMIQKHENRVEIMDLYSSNGTFLNGIQILPEKFHPLTSGTMIQLGHLKLIIIYSWRSDR
jgi:hypothetical protein